MDKAKKMPEIKVDGKGISTVERILIQATKMLVDDVENHRKWIGAVEKRQGIALIVLMAWMGFLTAKIVFGF